MPRPSPRFRERSPSFSVSSQDNSPSNSNKVGPTQHPRVGRRPFKTNNEPRTRKRHRDSSGESYSGDPEISYRSLRTDELPPQDFGLSPPKGHNPRKTARQHISAGTRAKEKSAYISGSRSLKVAAAWAAKQPGGGIVVKYTREAGEEYYDLTTPSDAIKIFGESSENKGKPKNTSLLNSAKSSQETLVKNKVSKDNIEAVYTSEAISEERYQELKNIHRQGDNWYLLKTRAEVTKGGEKTSPQPILVVEIYTKNSNLDKARQYFDEQIARLLSREQEEAREYLSEKNLNPYNYDYMTNISDFESFSADLQKCLADRGYNI